MSNLLIQEEPLLVLPRLAEAIGLNEAIVLQQIHYWVNKSDHIHDGRKWVYNTYEGWQEQFKFWSTRTIRRTLNSLEKSELLVIGNFNKRGFDKTKWYTINYDKLNLVDSPCVQNGQTIRTEWTHGVDNMTRPIPETTTETTTENIVCCNSVPACDGVLTTEQKEVSHGELDKVDVIGELYARYTNQLAPRTQDYVSIQNTLALDNDFDKILNLVEACLKEYKPSYQGDKINSFKYCETYVRNKLSQEGARRNAKNEVNSRSNPVNGADQPKTSSETQRLEKIARAKGLIKDGEIREVDCDF